MTEAGGNIVAKFKIKVKGKVVNSLDFREGSSLVIGRGNNVDFQIKSSALSRQHCRFLATPSGILLKDLNSLNGTFIQRRRVSEVFLRSGDEVQIGPIVIQVEIFAHPIPASSTGGHQQQFAGSQGGDNGRIASGTIAAGGDTKRVPTEAPKSRVIIHQHDFPQGTCLQCNKNLTQKDMATHMGVFKGNEIYCVPCFCEGAGNFPTIAGYRIIKKLGGGGMGDVYEAIQLSMERPVAFKLMKGLENASEQQIKRFFREARTGGKLNHPNIVGFIDAGKLEGACYIAMEFIYGIDLRQIMEVDGPFDCNEALRIALFVGKALDHANSRFNVVHRDVKPENILIDREKNIKLTDFGLAKNLEEAGLSGITKSQTGVGTLFYMSPEQIADARFADHRADIYSLGVTLYEILSGERPFFAAQMMPLVNKIRYEQPKPLNEHNPNIAPKICGIISKAMEKDPGKRYQKASEMMEEIKPLLNSNSIPDPM